jgi:hypothetical protein
MKAELTELRESKWVTAGIAPLSLLNLNSFGSRLLGMQESASKPPAGIILELGQRNFIDLS